jgi:hypothetical protein
LPQIDSVLSSEYGRSLGRGTLLVFLLFVLAGLVLDGGLTGQITLMAVMGYLGGAAIMAARRPLTPTATDVWLLRWGFIPLWVAAQVGVRLAWFQMGRL